MNLKFLILVTMLVMGFLLFGCSNTSHINSNPNQNIVPAPTVKMTRSSYNFTSYENTAPYYEEYCDKINPYDLSVRTAASEAIRNKPGSYNVDQLFDIYDWVKENIIYQNVPLAGIPYPPSETLTTKSGDCKNQAVLIASMVQAIGGNAKVILDPGCNHAYAIVYFGSFEKDGDLFVKAASKHYGSNISVNYFTNKDDIWIIFDPAGGKYPGDTLPQCSGKRTIYLITSCLDCSNKYSNTPYTFGDTCYSKCPSGTITSNQYACESCPQGYFSCNNQCITCQPGYSVKTDCRCWKD